MDLKYWVIFKVQLEPENSIYANIGPAKQNPVHALIVIVGSSLTYDIHFLWAYKQTSPLELVQFYNLVFHFSNSTNATYFTTVKMSNLMIDKGGVSDGPRTNNNLLTKQF